jgi:DhnA family fructose-bisphosphate aldolase class Ia
MNNRVKTIIALNLIAISMIVYIGLNMSGASANEIGIQRALIEAML